MLIFLLILCVFFLIALANVYVFAIFDENGFCGYIRFLFLKISFPKEKKAKEKLPEESKEKNKKPGELSNLKSMIEPAFHALGKLIRFLCIRKLHMEITVGTGDAFSTAMLYGGAAACVGAIFPILNQNLKINKKCINVMADFEASESTVYMDALVSVRIWQIFIIAFVFVIRYLKRIMKGRKDDKNGRARNK